MASPTLPESNVLLALFVLARHSDYVVDALSPSRAKALTASI